MSVKTTAQAIIGESSQIRSSGFALRSAPAARHRLLVKTTPILVWRPLSVRRGHGLRIQFITGSAGQSALLRTLWAKATFRSTLITPQQSASKPAQKIISAAPTRELAHVYPSAKSTLYSQTTSVRLAFLNARLRKGPSVTKQREHV